MESQEMTFWEIIKEEDAYIMFKVSITSGKKNPDGTWDNVSQSFTCFANGDAKNTFKALGLKQKDKIKVSGFISLLPEKRTAQGKNGEYQETIFSNATININTVELVCSAKNGGSQDYQKASGGSEAKMQSNQSGNDDIGDIPF